MSFYGDVLDYSTLIHEFGHFADNYINNGAQAPLDTLEISSQALELLMIKHLTGKVSQTDALLLKYSALCTVLETLIYQGLYARYEELVYELSYDDITMENLNKAVVAVAEEFGFNTDYVNEVSIMLIPHTVLYPFYVQSYCTSVVPAIEVYYMEKDESGAGFDAYKNLILREEYGCTFEEELETAGLTSPFTIGHIKDICNKIYYEIIGSNYFKDNNTQDKDAA